MHGSTILTIGTALSRAEQAGAEVFALVQGQWISGRVMGIDGHGVVLRSSGGESTVLRLEHVAAIRIDESAVAEPEDARDEQQVFTMGAGDAGSRADAAPTDADPVPASVATGLALAHLSA